MKKLLTSKIFLIVLTAMICISGTAYAAIRIQADEIGYKDGTVKDALNDLYTSLNNKTVDDNLYLYWLGNEYTDITGGWASTLNIEKWSADTNYTMSLKPATKNSDNYDLSTNNTFQYSPINTKNKIDCTKYNYINIYYSWTINYDTNYRVTKDLAGINYANDSGSNQLYRAHLTVNPNGKPVVVSYPISCSEAGYIAINTYRGVAGDSISDMKLYGVILSKEPMGIR